MPIILARCAHADVEVDWFRNLFKSHTQKRIEARRREEEARREAHRAAGPPPVESPNAPVFEPPATDGSKPHTRLDKAS